MLSRGVDLHVEVANCIVCQSVAWSGSQCGADQGKVWRGMKRARQGRKGKEWKLNMNS